MGFGYVSSKCPNRASISEEQKDLIDEQSEDQIYEPKLKEFDNLDNSENTPLGGIRTLPKNLDTIPLIPIPSGKPDSVSGSVCSYTLTFMIS